MTIDQPQPDLLEHLVVEFGDHGHRAAGFLEAAYTLLSRTEFHDVPRLPETIAYCLREAMKTIPASVATGEPMAC